MQVWQKSKSTRNLSFFYIIFLNWTIYTAFLIKHFCVYLQIIRSWTLSFSKGYGWRLWGVRADQAFLALRHQAVHRLHDPGKHMWTVRNVISLISPGQVPGQAHQSTFFWPGTELKLSEMELLLVMKVYPVWIFNRIWSLRWRLRPFRAWHI